MVLRWRAKVLKQARRPARDSADDGAQRREATTAACLIPPDQRPPQGQTPREGWWGWFGGGLSRRPARGGRGGAGGHGSQWSGAGPVMRRSVSGGEGDVAGKRSKSRRSRVSWPLNRTESIASVQPIDAGKGHRNHSESGGPARRFLGRDTRARGATRRPPGIVGWA